MSESHRSDRGQRSEPPVHPIDAQRLSFLALVAWLSVCLIIAGWQPNGTPMSNLWLLSGIAGLASALGLAVSVKSDLKRHQRLLDAYITEARTDPLTGLANRRAFQQELNRRIAQFQRQESPVSLLMIDVDHFKPFNDRHGHQAGDEMLRAVADLLARTMRDMDLVARYGGEEFAVVLPGTTDEQAVCAAHRVWRAVNTNRLAFRGQSLQVTVSIGIAHAADGDDAGNLVRRADLALYAAKEAGRNRCFLEIRQRCMNASPHELVTTT